MTDDIASLPGLTDRLAREAEGTLCPKCGSKNVIHYGKRKTRAGTTTILCCKDCDAHFTLRKIRFTPYDSLAIIRAMNMYNEGFSFIETAKRMRSRYKVSIPPSTISNWTKRYLTTFPFLSLRKKYRIKPMDQVQTRRFYHKQVYDMRLHRLKLNIAAKAFPSLPRYMYYLMKAELGETFKSDTRCSIFRPSPFKATPKTFGRNLATDLTNLAQTLAKSKKQRHDVIEEFFLINDATTFATEVPVYMSVEEAKNFGLNISETLTGHIDMLQFRNGRIYILDYKPDTDPKNAQEQLCLYALCLNRRTGIPLSRMTCAAFNKDAYAEFDP
jgi:hypothetical protein